MMRKAYLLLTAIVLIALSGCDNRKTPTDFSPFVKREGAAFMLEGKEYRFVGTNF